VSWYGCQVRARVPVAFDTHAKVGLAEIFF
jgi:hypothetical protein